MMLPDQALYSDDFDDGSYAAAALTRPTDHGMDEDDDFMLPSYLPSSDTDLVHSAPTSSQEFGGHGPRTMSSFHAADATTYSVHRAAHPTTVPTVSEGLGVLKPPKTSPGFSRRDTDAVLRHPTGSASGQQPAATRSGARLPAHGTRQGWGQARARSGQQSLGGLKVVSIATIEARVATLEGQAASKDQTIQNLEHELRRVSTLYEQVRQHMEEMSQLKESMEAIFQQMFGEGGG